MKALRDLIKKKDGLNGVNQGPQCDEEKGPVVCNQMSLIPV